VPERAYEMVSPVFKDGYGTTGIEGVRPDGQVVTYGSLGSFAGDSSNKTGFNAYSSRREADGWRTVPLVPPASEFPYAFISDYSSSLELSLAYGKPGQNEGYAYAESPEFDYLAHDVESPDEASFFELVGVALLPLNPETEFKLDYRGGSESFSHVIFASLRQPLVAAAVKTRSDLYDLAMDGSGHPHLVEVNNKGQPIRSVCEPEVGSASGRQGDYDGVSVDGQEVFFSVGVAGESSTECLEHSQLFVRTGSARTIEVSRSLDATKPFGGCAGEVGGAVGEVPCKGASTRPPAEFQGADEAGTRAFFTTTAPLTADDSNTTNDLYEARVGCTTEAESCEPSQRTVTALALASHGAEAAEVQNVVEVAQDGSRVYFVARGALSTEANAEGARSVKGADNLYVYDARTGATPTYITELCSGPEESGTVEDARCPAGLTPGPAGRNDTRLWSAFDREAQANECVGATQSCEPARFLVFSSYGQLTADDADSAEDIYRYDAVRGRLERVSVGESGSDSNGNDNAFDATLAVAQTRYQVYQQHHLNSRAMSADGRTIVFSSAGPLSTMVANGVVNAYEWHEGAVSLVSTGSSDQSVEQVVMSASAEDIFFTTTQGLVRQDTDGQYDVYDARVGGGFPEAPVARQPCSGDACQGPLSEPAPLLIPGSASQAPGENFVPSKVGVKPTKRAIRRKKKTARRSSRRTDRRRRTTVRGAGGR
jgi:hypothetical protein